MLERISGLGFPIQYILWRECVLHKLVRTFYLFVRLNNTTRFCFILKFSSWYMLANNMRHIETYRFVKKDTRFLSKKNKNKNNRCQIGGPKLQFSLYKWAHESIIAAIQFLAFCCNFLLTVYLMLGILGLKFLYSKFLFFLLPVPYTLKFNCVSGLEG